MRYIVTIIIFMARGWMAGYKKESCASWHVDNMISKMSTGFTSLIIDAMVINFWTTFLKKTNLNNILKYNSHH